jgi:hypothetical protein
MRPPIAVALLIACSSGKPAAPPPPPADVIAFDGTVDLAAQSIQDQIGVPMSGTVHVRANLQHAKHDLRTATGTVRVTCVDACTLLSQIDLGSFDIVVTFANGSATITKWDVVSPHVTLIVSGGIALERTLADSRLDACVRYDLKPKLMEERPKAYSALMLTGAARSAKDGLLNIALRDRFAAPRRTATICDGSPPSGEPSSNPAPGQK